MCVCTSWKQKSQAVYAVLKNMAVRFLAEIVVAFMAYNMDSYQITT